MELRLNCVRWYTCRWLVSVAAENFSQNLKRSSKLETTEPSLPGATEYQYLTLRQQVDAEIVFVNAARGGWDQGIGITCAAPNPVNKKFLFNIPSIFIIEKQ